ncbi:MAG TPA: hypothetical protein VFN76_01420 [Candidatus Limnocylindria bacterium]|nr:hypothetical protein [Candidatus Limnocylindria bacterium]
MNIARVKDDVVWGQLRIIFMGSALLFLINNFFGFANALTEGAINRGQILVHLHAGSVGWITLSAIGLAVWLVTGQRTVDDGYRRKVQRLGWAAVIAFACYIPNFWLAFGPVGFRVLLPVFGIASVLVLWWAAIFAIGQVRAQESVTTPQFLAAGGLLVASIGATVGALLGLENAMGRTFLPLASDRVGAHAAMMDTYLFLIAGAIVESVIRPVSDQRLRWPGIVQGTAWVIGAALVPTAYFLDLIEAILPLFGLLLLLGMGFFLVRIAWRAILAGPMASGARAWTFFGSAWLVVYMGFFLAAVSGGGDFSSLPEWFLPVFAHIGFVGMMTNLVLALHLERADAQRGLASWAEPTAMWLINIGLIVFLGLRITAEIRLGAIVMGIGVVLGVATVLYRLWNDGRSPVADAPPMEASAA